MIVHMKLEIIWRTLARNKTSQLQEKAEALSTRSNMRHATRGCNSRDTSSYKITYTPASLCTSSIITTANVVLNKYLIYLYNSIRNILAY